MSGYFNYPWGIFFFDADPLFEVRGVFLETSKAFDQVGNEGSIYKIKCIGVNRDLLPLIETFFNQKTTKSFSGWTII